MTEPSIVYLYLQGKLHPDKDDLFNLYLEQVRPIMKQFGSKIWAVGEGLPLANEAKTWPINAVFTFPDLIHVDRFFSSQAYNELVEKVRKPAFAHLSTAIYEKQESEGESGPPLTGSVIAIEQFSGKDRPDPSTWRKYGAAHRYGSGVLRDYTNEQHDHLIISVFDDPIRASCFLHERQDRLQARGTQVSFFRNRRPRD